MTHSALWSPYAQMKTLPEKLRVKSAKGVYIHLENGTNLIDAVSSWWCAIHGYSNPEINQAASEQMGEMSHMMLGGLSNDPSEQLAEKLVEVTPNGLNHVFFGDSGSVGVEIALKMAIQFWRNKGINNKDKILALKHAYHGDTCGCMSVCDPDTGMHSLFSSIVPKQFFVNAPQAGFNASDTEVENDIKTLEVFLQQNHKNLAAFIIEPILQGAGGFRVYSPKYLRAARNLCDEFDVLLICDEVATGFGRTGKMFACEHGDICPDIMVLGKGLTGGYVSHSATLANDRVYDNFYSDDAGKAFMHGPTFMGNALTCAIALKSLEIFQRDNYLDKIARIEHILTEELSTFTHPKVKATRVIGATGVIELHKSADAKGVQEFCIKRGVWLRPYINHMYVMPPYIISEQELRTITQAMKDALG